MILLRSLVRKGAAGVLIQVAGLMLSLLSTIVLARCLGPKFLGIYSSSFALLSLFLVAADSGVSTLFIRDGATYLKNKNSGLLSGLIQWGLLRVFIVSVGILFLGLVVIFLLKFNDYQRFFTNAVMLFALPPAVLLKSIGHLLRTLDAPLSSMVLDKVIRPTLFICICASVFVFPSVRAPVIPMIAQFGSACVCLIISTGLLNRLLPPNLFKEESCYDLKNWKKSSFLFMAMGGVGVLNSNADLVLIDFLASSRDVGLYRIAVQGATLVSLGLQTMNIIVSPKIAGAFAERNFVRMQQLVLTSSRFSTLIAAVAFIIFYATGTPLIDSIFSVEYEESLKPLIWLSIGQLINAIMGPVGFLLKITGNEKSLHRFLGLLLV